MGRYDIFSLSEEQMAAYLDGMLNTEQSNMVEELIASDENLQQIQDAIDAVDSTFIAHDPTEEIPLECLADDFVLPEIVTLDDIAHNDAMTHDDLISDDVAHDDLVDVDEADDGFAGDDGVIDDSDAGDDYVGDDYGYDDAVF